MPTIQELEARAEILARRNDELEQKLAASDRRADQLEVRSMQSDAAAERAVIESHLRIAAHVAGSTEGPIEDAVRTAMREATWKLDTKGKLLRVLPDGQWDMTEQGDYVSASTWMRDYARKMPSYFPSAQSSAADSASAPSGTGPNPWSASGWNQTKQSEYEASHGTAKAEAMASAAGSSVYATTPPKGGN